jgi:hypothetical protein
MDPSELVPQLSNYSSHPAFKKRELKYQDKQDQKQGTFNDGFDSKLFQDDRGYY